MMNQMILLFCFFSFFSHGENSFNQKSNVFSEKAVHLVDEHRNVENNSSLSVGLKKKEKLAQVQSKALSADKKQTEPSAKEYLIERLDYLNKVLPKNHKAKNPLKLRLAHILSLLAEENFTKVDKENCKACKTIARSLARRSLSVYKEIDSLLSTRHPLLHVEALFKQAYLHSFFGESAQSLIKLKRIITKKAVDPLFITRAWFSIGEIHFERYDYETSLKAFNKVLENKTSPWRFKALYRKIWSLSNLSLYEKSIDELESFLNSDLYSNPDLSLEERELRKRLENELVTLYSYGKITNERLAFLYNFSKQDQNNNILSEKNRRLFRLANALSRVGQMSSSNKVWRMYLSKVITLKDELQAYFFMVNNDFNLDKIDFLQDTGQKIEKIFNLQEKVKVSEEFKQDINRQAKRFFNQVQLKLSLLLEDRKKYLLSLYQKYNSIYQGGDVESLYVSGILAKDLKKYVLAQRFFQFAVKNVKDKENPQLKEDMCLLQMKMAEFSKDVKSRLNAYEFYMEFGKDKTWLYKARYQKTYMSYKSKEYKKSAELFKSLALYKTEEGKDLKEIQELRLKSAHLSLSSLDQIEDQEEELALRAGLFMKEFPQNRKEFIRIYHSAVLNTVKKLVSGKDFSRRPFRPSSDKNVLKAWQMLQLISVKETKKEEFMAYYFNRLLLAKEMLDFKSMDQSIQVLLSGAGLKEEDKKTILTWKLWLAELHFDFEEVLRIAKILQSEEPSEESLLRLARLAELAGKSPISYYKHFVEKFPDSQSLTAVLTSIVDKSPVKSKKAVLKKYAEFFKKTPDALTRLILKVDKGYLDTKFIKSFVSLDFMKDTPLVVFLKRKETIESFEKSLFGVSAYYLSRKTVGWRLKKAIKNYRKKVDQLSSQAEKTLQARDWTVRVFAVSQLKKELSRFYDSIINLPFPKGLTKEEQIQYMELLKEQLEPYKIQIAQLRSELASLWSRDFLTSYKTGIEQSDVFYRLLSWEMEKLFTVSEGENKEQLKSLLSSIDEKTKKVKTVAEEDSQTKHLYRKLKKNPFDEESLIQLLELEKTKKNEVMSFYLADRIKELKRKSDWTKL